jgi:hypothetical protein
MSETNVQLFPGVFRTTQGGSNPDFFLHSAGRVGIGNDAPDTPPAWNTNTTFKLNVTGHTHVNGNLDVTGYLYGDGSTLSGVTAVIGGYWDLDQANNNIKYDVGNVGIGGAASTEKLKVYGDILATGDVTASSDRRLKTDIKRIEGALDKVCAIGGYTYVMNDKPSTGLIAQEVREVLPEVVHGSEETSYSIAYGNVIGLLVEAIKELKEKIG